MKIYIPIRTVSEANRSRHEHWAVTRKRAKEQRELARMMVRAAFNANREVMAFRGMPVAVTRVAPRLLDMDNLAASQKHVTDGIADALGIDDRHIAWTYAQRRGRPKEWAVEIEL